MHVAIIMDGNGRWATRRGLPRAAGHRAGAKALKRVVEAAPALGVDKLTVFAFSSDNWRRPAAEVDALMRLLGAYLRDETERHARKGTRLPDPPETRDTQNNRRRRRNGRARLYVRDL
jgi:undecaprenyl diphosphate synthase